MERAMEKHRKGLENDITRMEEERVRETARTRNRDRESERQKERG